MVNETRREPSPTMTMVADPDLRADLFELQSATVAAHDYSMHIPTEPLVSLGKDFSQYNFNLSDDDIFNLLK